MTDSYEGHCHCGAIGFSYTTDLPPSRWSVRACQCGFCCAQGARYTSNPNGSVRFPIARPTALTRYSFGFRTADFLHCLHCGAYIAAIISTQRGIFTAVNLNSFTAVLPELPSAHPVSYDSESREQRAARRQRRWTPVRGGI